MSQPFGTKSTTETSKSHVTETRHSIGEMVSKKIFQKFFKLKKSSKMPHMEQLLKKPILTSFSPIKLKKKSSRSFLKGDNFKFLTNNVKSNKLT